MSDAKKNFEKENKKNALAGMAAAFEKTAKARKNSGDLAGAVEAYEVTVVIIKALFRVVNDDLPDEEWEYFLKWREKLLGKS